MFSCKTSYVTVYRVIEEPLSFNDTVIYEYDHWHFCDKDNDWICVELEPDTIAINFNDTICFTVYDGVKKVERTRKNRKNILSLSKN